MLIKISIIRASRRAGPLPWAPSLLRDPNTSLHPGISPSHFGFLRANLFPPLPVIQQNLFWEWRKWLQGSLRQRIVKSCLPARNLRVEGRGKQRFSKLRSLYYPLSLPQHRILRSSLSGCSLSVPTSQPILPLSALLDGVQRDRALADPWNCVHAGSQGAHITWSVQCHVAGPQLSGGYNSTLVKICILSP